MCVCVVYAGNSKVARKLKSNKIASVAVPLNMNNVKSSGYGQQPSKKKNVTCKYAGQVIAVIDEKL